METIARIPYHACPLCSHQDATLVCTADCTRHPLYRQPLPATLRWVRCQRCQHVFTDGYFGDEAQQVLLGSAHAGQTPGHEVSASRLVAARIIETVTAHLGKDVTASPRARWLDVGFGSGALLTTAAEFGYDALGIDIRESSVRRLREFGYAASCAEFTRFLPPANGDGQQEGSCQVIAMADVLEHMPFPIPALHHAYRLLAPGGVLFVSMPNLDCFLFRHLDRAGQNPYWAEIEHYHNFSRARLYDLLAECGFTTCHYGVSQRYVACMEIIARKTATGGR